MPYNFVCSKWCDDKVCVAWLYENDSMDEPYFPPYESRLSRLNKSRVTDVDDCPSKDAWCFSGLS